MTLVSPHQNRRQSLWPVSSTWRARPAARVSRQAFHWTIRHDSGFNKPVEQGAQRRVAQDLICPGIGLPADARSSEERYHAIIVKRIGERFLASTVYVAQEAGRHCAIDANRLRRIRAGEGGPQPVLECVDGECGSGHGKRSNFRV